MGKDAKVDQSEKSFTLNRSGQLFFEVSTCARVSCMRLIISLYPSLCISRLSNTGAPNGTPVRKFV